MKILVTNDDGVHADGIFFLKKELEKIGEVTVFAPDKERSAVGHALTMHRPLRIEKVLLRDGSMAYTTNGTPSDCVLLAVLTLERPDLVVSGINKGPNLGDDMTYSGTVSAAMEATIHGIQAIAVSSAEYKNIDYEFIAKITSKIVLEVSKNHLPNSTFLNINIPKNPKGVKITRQGKRIYQDMLNERIDPKGEKYYWISGEPLPDEEEGTDMKAIFEGFISITPLQLDLTDYKFLEKLKKWNFKL